MRFVSYLILVYVMLGLQGGIEPYFKPAPNLALLTVIFVALNATRDAALLGSFFIGLAQDSLTSQPPGLYAMSYGLLAMLVVAMHHSLKRNHAMTHLTLAAVGGVIAATAITVHEWIHPAGHAVMLNARTSLSPMRVPISAEWVRVLYTIMLAPIVLVALGRTKGLFGFQTDRRIW